MPDKTFTQQELNTLVARERRRYEEQLGELTEQLAVARANAGSLEAKLQSRAQEVTAANDALVAASQQHQAYLDGYRDRQLRAAFTEEKAYEDALPLITREFLSEAKLEQQPDGTISSVEYQGAPQKDLRTAAQTFLSQRPFFMPPRQGAGSPRRFVQGMPAERDVTKENPVDLARRGWNARETP